METATTIGKVTLHVSSPAFEDKGFIPLRYTCEGENINPPLTVKGLPPEAVSLVLIIEDPDASEKIFDHWIVWNVSPQETIAENSTPGNLGRNSEDENTYIGPCPPSGTHRYFFKVYALDAMLDLPDDADKKVVEQALLPHVMAYGEFVGLYKKEE
jgi:Raf kinase inhibitor-like YbhB/YbcL family protein